MKKEYLVILSFALLLFVTVSFHAAHNEHAYRNIYKEKLNKFVESQELLNKEINHSNLSSQHGVANIRTLIENSRLEMKSVDFWLRYLDPLSYKKINGPLLVEWETEVFEKFEAPYKREGTGLSLALLYLEEKNLSKDSLLKLIEPSVNASNIYLADSITNNLSSSDHFFFCNRLFLLNLSSIYTTGFECPDSSLVVPELRNMLKSVQSIYTAYNASFSETALTKEYVSLFQNAILFCQSQPDSYSSFDHFTFLQRYVNPLFIINQQLILNYKSVSRSLVDYSLSKTSKSIFSKDLYHGQNTKGIFIRVKDEAALQLLDKVGKSLFYDPILSGNNKRSCVSCHKPTQFFTDTLTATSLQFNKKYFLRRNSPSLINSEYNHLLMVDGKHISLQEQGKGVITDSLELGSVKEDVLKKILSCKEYKDAFTKLLIYTPQEEKITFEQITSALSFYYTKFSAYSSPFDHAMNQKGVLDDRVVKGFNLFMSKAQCATCHFVPHFNGVKPPFVNSEFEVLGVPHDTTYKTLGSDKGRHEVFPAHEMNHAFRTGSLRNIEHTKPYMHNGVFSSLKEVVDFYDAGGGAGKGLNVPNQTLFSDALYLTEEEKENLILFMKSLTEQIPFEIPPIVLPISKNKTLNTRKVGGEY